MIVPDLDMVHIKVGVDVHTQLIKDVDYSKKEAGLSWRDEIDTTGNTRMGHSQTPASHTLMDIYLPKSPSMTRSQEIRKIPLVLFVHGGGWRRGGKTAWKYYISEHDTNILVAFVTWWFGIYGNVGESFGAHGIACAVMNYPLCRLQTTWRFLELMISFLMSVLCLSPLAVVIIFVLDKLEWIALLAVEDSCSVANILATSHVLLWILIVFFRRQYKTSAITICVLCLAQLLLYCQPIFRIYFRVISVAVTLVFTAHNGHHSRTDSMNKINYKTQIVAITNAVSWLYEFGKDTRVFDPENIFLMGHSAGGHLVSMVMAGYGHSSLKQHGLNPSCIKGVIAISGIFNLHNLDTFLGRHLYLKPAFDLDPDNLTLASPLYVLSDTLPKYLVINARLDSFLISDAEDMCKELETRGVECFHRVIPRTNHFTIMNLFCEGTTSTIVQLCVQFVLTANRQRSVNL